MTNPNPFTVERIQREMNGALEALAKRIATGDPPKPPLAMFLMVQTADGVQVGGTMHPAYANVLLAQAVLGLLQQQATDG